ncbi:MAG: metallophosphoesterase family protein [Armatimonadaceae bacterium]
MASVWAIGDIHGECAKLEALLANLPREEDDITVYLGDYIDRGPDSAGVVRRVLADYDAAPGRTVLLWGNHEDMAAGRYGLSRPSSFEYDIFDWYRNGGIQAMKSWGHGDYDLFQADIPEELKRLVRMLKPYWTAPEDRFPKLKNCVWVHAGVLPDTPTEELSGDILLWVRDEFLHHPDELGRLVIHGHTPVRKVRVTSDKIGIDTGAVFGGMLTALQMPERRIYQADEDGKVTSEALPEPEDD